MIKALYIVQLCMCIHCIVYNMFQYEKMKYKNSTFAQLGCTCKKTIQKFKHVYCVYGELGTWYNSCITHYRDNRDNLLHYCNNGLPIIAQAYLEPVAIRLMLEYSCSDHWWYTPLPSWS